MTDRTEPRPGQRTYKVTPAGKKDFGDREADPVVKFWNRVQLREDGCWEWVGILFDTGYGALNFDRRPHLAHRFAYELLVGPIPEGLCIDHLCHDHECSVTPASSCPHRRCVRPSHMEPITRGANTMRGNTLTRRLSEQTHCKRGHPFNEENTYMHPLPGGSVARDCRECTRIAERLRRRAKALGYA